MRTSVDRQRVERTVLCLWLLLLSYEPVAAAQAVSPSDDKQASEDKKASDKKKNTKKKDPTWFAGQISQENDSFVAGDERYTQGLRLQLLKTDPPRFVESIQNRLKGRIWSEDLEFVPSFSIFLGQNMYTPEIITTPRAYPGDRAFVGALYGGVQLQFTEKGRTRRHTFEGYLGWRGQAAMAGAAQKALHVLRFRRIPKGWDLQDPSDPLVNVNYRLERRFKLCTRKPVCFADLTGGGLAALGNMRTGAGLHGAVRVGYGLTGFPLAAVPNTLNSKDEERRRFEIGFTAGYEGRAVADNGLLRPSAASGLEFKAEPYVGDTTYGGYVRFKDGRFSLLEVRRSAEFSFAGQPARSQKFLSVGLSYEPPAPHEWDPPGLLRDLRAELGLGNSPLGPRLSSGSREPGPAARAGLSKGLFGPLFVGFEIGGTIVENQPATNEADTHNDTFLIYRAVTLGWRPGRGHGRLSLRAGPTLFGQTAKIETTHNPVVGGKPLELLDGRYSDGGAWGWIGGLHYMLAPEKHVAFGVGATYGHLRLRQSVPGVRQTNFIAATMAVELRFTPAKKESPRE